MIRVPRNFVSMIAIMGIAAAVPASAAEKNQAERRKALEVYLNMADEPPSMDPTKQADAVSGMWLGHIYEGLMTTDKTGKYVQGAAEKMNVSADGKTYTFTIRKNARWHDGKPVSAKDFEFAFRRLVDPKFASEYSFIAVTAQIVNADEIIKGQKPLTELGAKAVDDKTFEVQLKSPVSFFPSLMAFSVFSPVREDIVKKYGDKFAADAESIVGNGPFKLARWVHEASLRIEKSDTYWNAKEIKLKAIEAPTLLKDLGAMYNQFSTGGLDIVNLDRERLKIAQQDKRAIRSYNDGSVFWIEMNQRQGALFAHPKMREAMRLGLNRAELVNKVLAVPGTKPAFGLVPDYMPGSVAGSSFRKEGPIKYKDSDIEGAKKAIAAYLAETKQAKVPSFTLLADDGTTGKIQSEYLQSVLKKVFDTEVKIDSVPFKTRLQRMRDGKFDIVWAGWGPDYVDAMTFMDLFMSTNENNHGEFKDAKFDEMIKSAQTEADAVKRMKMLTSAENYLIVEKSAIAPLYQRARAYLLADGLEGIRRPQVGADPDFRFAFWKN